MTADLLERWEQLKAKGEPQGSPEPPAPRNSGLYRPLSDAADEFVHWAQTPEQRVLLGIPDIDAEMRGIAPGELAIIVGYSHSGKTLVMLEVLKNNRNRRVLYFGPDEPRPLVLVKLTCALHGLRARELEDRVMHEDPSAVQLLKRTASEDYPQLAVFDQAVGIADMERAYGEMTDHWGAAPELIVFDYLQQLKTCYGDPAAQADELKAWGRRHDVPLLVLHQTSRSSGAEGKALTISSGAFGGEQQATHMVGVRRKLFEIEAKIAELKGRSNQTEKVIEELDLALYLARIHQHTLTLSLLKNKRPDASRLPEVDYEIEKGTGRLTRLEEGVFPSQYLQEEMRL